MSNRLPPLLVWYWLCLLYVSDDDDDDRDDERPLLVVDGEWCVISDTVSVFELMRMHNDERVL
jgi:hypothetical protein